MIYFFLLLSLVFNGLLVWYIRKILSKYWYDVEVRKSFTAMLNDYEQTITSIYKLEEFYGEETLKKAIAQTKFVVQACEEFKQILEKDTIEEAEGAPEEEIIEEESASKEKESVIKLKEGEKVTQDASSYRRVVTET